MYISHVETNTDSVVYPYDDPNYLHKYGRVIVRRINP